MLSDEFWAEVHQRTKHIEEMLGTLIARSQGHRKEDQSNSASSSRHQASRDSIQIQNFCAKDPSHTSPSQVITLSPSLLENLSEKQPTKETPPSPSPLETLPKQQPTKETSTPSPSKDPEPITAQKKDQPPRFPQTPPPINPSAQTLSLPKIPAKTEKNDSFWPKPKVQPPPTPPKFPPCSPIDQPRHQPPQSPATLFPISSAQQSPYLKTTSRQPQTQRTKPKKPPPPLRPYLFHTDWSRRRKRARFKTRHFLARRKPLAVSKFGMNGSGRGKKDPGLGKRGPKKKRQVQRDNVRGLKVLAIRRSARKRLGEQTGPGLRSPFPGQRQDPEAGAMEGGPTERVSPPGYFPGRRRPPKWPPDGYYAQDGDVGMNNSSPDLAVRNMHFPLSEVDRGGRLSLPCREKTEIESEIFGFFDGGKLQENLASREGVRDVDRGPVRAWLVKEDRRLRPRFPDFLAGREGNPDCADEGKLNGIMVASEISGFSVAGEVKSESAAGGKLKSIMASGISAGREPNPKYAARRKWKGVAAEREGTHVCATLHKEIFCLTYSPHGRLQMKEIRNSRVQTGARVA